MSSLGSANPSVDDLPSEEMDVDLDGLAAGKEDMDVDLDGLAAGSEDMPDIADLPELVHEAAFEDSNDDLPNLHDLEDGTPLDGLPEFSDNSETVMYIRKRKLDILSQRTDDPEFLALARSHDKQKVCKGTQIALPDKKYSQTLSWDLKVAVRKACDTHLCIAIPISVLLVCVFELC